MPWGVLVRDTRPARKLRQTDTAVVGPDRPLISIRLAKAFRRSQQNSASDAS